MYPALFPLNIDLPKGSGLAFSGGRVKPGKARCCANAFRIRAATIFSCPTNTAGYCINRHCCVKSAWLWRKSISTQDLRLYWMKFGKVQELLNEVHWLIETAHLQFILCGSSTNKLRRGHGNLFGEERPAISALYPDLL